MLIYSFLCWFLTLDRSIQRNFATLSEVVGNPLILPIYENGSSHIDKKFFSLKIDHAVYQIDGNFALIHNNNRTWIVKSRVFFGIFDFIRVILHCLRIRPFWFVTHLQYILLTKDCLCLFGNIAVRLIFCDLVEMRMRSYTSHSHKAVRLIFCDLVEMRVRSYSSHSHRVA